MFKVETSCRYVTSGMKKAAIERMRRLFVRQGFLKLIYINVIPFPMISIYFDKFTIMHGLITLSSVSCINN